MNALQQYFSQTGDNAHQLAIRAGRSSSTITRALEGSRNCSMDVALDVEKATGGEVSALQFLEICLDAKRSKALTHHHS